MQPEHLELNSVIVQFARMLRRLLGEDIALQIKTEKVLPAVWADHAMIEQVILNLAVNARDAMPKGGQLLIRTFPVEIDACRAPDSDSRRHAFRKWFAGVRSLHRKQKTAH